MNSYLRLKITGDNDKKYMKGVFSFSSGFVNVLTQEFSIFMVKIKDYDITVEYKTNSIETLIFDLTVDIMSGMLLHAGTIEFKPIRAILDLLYPVCSIYISMNSIDPESLFGGSWEQIKDRFMYCHDSSMKTCGNKKKHESIACTSTLQS